MESLFICRYVRSPFGRFGKSMSMFHPKLTGGYLVNSVIADGLNKDGIDHLMVGCSMTANLGPSLSSQIGQMSATIGDTINMTIHDGIASGIKALQLVSNLKTRNGINLVLGVDNLSLSPHYLPMARWKTSFGDQRLIDALRRDVLTDATSDISRGILAEAQIKKGKLTRSKLDEYTNRSFTNFEKALKKNGASHEIVPFKIKNGDAANVTIDVDDFAEKVTPDALKTMNPIFMKEGTLTGGSSAGISDGAALLVCANADAVKKYNLIPIIKIVDIVTENVEPKDYNGAGILATKKLMNSNELKIDDIDIFEIHEDFASTPLLFAKELKVPKAKINPNGGALSIGDAGAASGIRLIGSLANQIKYGEGKYGVAVLSDVTGFGVSVLVEAV